jgi:hypothetical protein
VCLCFYRCCCVRLCLPLPCLCLCLCPRAPCVYAASIRSGERKLAILCLLHSTMLLSSFYVVPFCFCQRCTRRPKFVYSDANLSTPVALITGVSPQCSPPSASCCAKCNRDHTGLPDPELVPTCSQCKHPPTDWTYTQLQPLQGFQPQAELQSAGRSGGSGNGGNGGSGRAASSTQALSPIDAAAHTTVPRKTDDPLAPAMVAAAVTEQVIVMSSRAIRRGRLPAA